MSDNRPIDAYDLDFVESMRSLAIDYYKAIQESGSCVDQDVPHLFYDSANSQKAIKNFCRDCPVRRECLHYSLIVPEQSGTWGGFDEYYRHGLVAMTRLDLRKVYPDVRFEELFINNSFVWNHLVNKFDEAAQQPIQLCKKDGHPQLKKNKEKNYLVS